jgi:hypothetical protein
VSAFSLKSGSSGGTGWLSFVVRREKNKHHLEQVAFGTGRELHCPVRLPVEVPHPVADLRFQFFLRPVRPPPNMAVEVISIRSFLAHSETSLSALDVRYNF